MTAQQCLCHLLRTLWEPENLAVPAALPRSQVVQLARSGQVSPLLHAAIQKRDLPVPEKIRATLEQDHYRMLAVDTSRFEQLKLLQAALSASGCPLLLLKGAALARTLYRDLALRVIGDLDLAVPQQHVIMCEQALSDLGYVPCEIEMTPGADLAYRGERIFVHRDGTGTAVELHWHLIDVPYYLRNVPMDWFWQNTDVVEIGGHKAQVLNPEANLLYLPAHLALHHRFHGLRWFVDLALLVHGHQDSLDWDKVATAAQEFELLLILRETLQRLAGYWPSLPLQEPLGRLQALEPTATERRLFRLLTFEKRAPLLDFYTDIVYLPDWPARTRFVWLNLFPQQAYMVRRYGIKRAWALPYWYLYRLGDGLAKMARTLPQVLRLDREPQ